MGVFGKSGFLLVFAIDSRESFQVAQRIGVDLLEKINYETESHPIILIGNKTDLSSDRRVSEAEANAYVQQQNLHSYRECTARTHENVIPIFQTLLQQMVTYRRRLDDQRPNYPDDMNDDQPPEDLRPEDTRK